jgi:hypothetical protein
VGLVKPTPTLARRFWEAIEPIHAVVYFAAEPADAARRAGLRGFWMGYFAGRVAPMGPVPPASVAAMAYGFAPAMVARAIPDAWRFADPAAVLDARITGAADALCTNLDPAMTVKVTELSGLLWEAVAGCRFEGRPLAAAWSKCPVPATPWRRAGWQRPYCVSTAATVTSSPGWPPGWAGSMPRSPS